MEIYFALIGFGIKINDISVVLAPKGFINNIIDLMC